MPRPVAFCLGLMAGAATSYLVERVTFQLGRWYDAVHIDLTHLTD